MRTWWWEAYSADGVRQIADSVSDPFADTPADVADLGMARMMICVDPDFVQLRGWRVRAWADGVGEAWAEADEWLRAVRGSRR